MKILHTLNSKALPSTPCVITIGNFDGVHLGHQSLLKKMRERVGKEGCVCVVTFTNHPLSVIQKRNDIDIILSNTLKVKYLMEFGVDILIHLEFTNELANQTYDQFLGELQKACPFDHLILGQGASLGKNREGTAEKIEQLGTSLGYLSEFVEKIKVNDEVVSSRAIRSFIKKGELKKAEEFLGRPFVIEASLERNSLQTSPGICLPPDGNYSVWVVWDDKKVKSTLHIRQGSLFLEHPFRQGKILIYF